MRATIFTPYLDTIGGGERYMLSIARALLEEGWNVEIETKSPELIEKAENRFGFSLKGLKAVETIRKGEGSDLCVWLSDGSVPTLHSRKNILHFQRPFQDVDGRSFISRMKFFRISKVIVNSEFTKGYIDSEYPVKSFVLYPPVDVDRFAPSKKLKQILYVGRFSQLEQSKRQDVLLQAFLKFYKFQGAQWKLVLAGGSDVGRTDEIEILKEHATGHPVEIIENPPFDKVQKLFAQSTFFWSAAGFGADEKTQPQKLEHFGMVVVEAMSAGCIPLVFNGGGHPEIIEHGVNGFLWDKPAEMLFATKKLISDSAGCKQIAEAAKVRSQVFSYERFKAEFLQLL